MFIMDIHSTAILNNGVEIPMLGLGAFRLGAGSETVNAVLWALEVGYRHVDTAMIYGNEREVGLALKKSPVPREKVFITTKLWNSHHGFDSTLKACDESLSKLGMDYIDLYLVHWPAEGKREETWKAIEKLYEGGKCRSIGVSNYTIKHLEELSDYAEVVPAVNQVEFSPYLYQKKLLDYCNEHGIKLEAYRSLTKGVKLADQRLVEIASRDGKTPAQVLLRWALQHEVIIIPKSAHKERIIENSQLFDFKLSKEDMKLLDSFNENFRTGWDPTEIP